MEFKLDVSGEDGYGIGSHQMDVSGEDGYGIGSHQMEVRPAVDVRVLLTWA